MMNSQFTGHYVGKAQDSTGALTFLKFNLTEMQTLLLSFTVQICFSMFHLKRKSVFQTAHKLKDSDASYNFLGFNQLNIPGRLSYKSSKQLTISQG